MAYSVTYGKLSTLFVVSVTGKKLREEGGDTKGASAILRRLPVPKMRDMLLPERLANVWCDACKLRLSYASDKILHLSERG
ncbi:hypothetical protein SARC_14854, partial [Sphaeroforma arctica JP610]